ncbi:hypothetical protein F511_22463 [Dorcoceras hygrometricum]|uniref:Uncharacterized protein n=1 Tax=Dorcoceras hygrometricum TaxID=472368 RepID=A0A2Z7D0W0_9LAMI|nr:hypothetical protein F511_22463 [Dorcoceras hygrometricum]
MATSSEIQVLPGMTNVKQMWLIFDTRTGTTPPAARNSKCTTTTCHHLSRTLQLSVARVTRCILSALNRDCVRDVMPFSVSDLRIADGVFVRKADLVDVARFLDFLYDVILMQSPDLVWVLVLEAERVTLVSLTSLLVYVSHYEPSGYLPHLMSWQTAGYHGFSAGRGVDPIGSASGDG